MRLPVAGSSPFVILFHSILDSQSASPLANVFQPLFPDYDYAGIETLNASIIFRWMGYASV